MNKLFAFLIILFFSFNSFAQEDRKQYFPSQEEKLNKQPDKSKVWVFIMAGQSNMAGRGFVEPKDTISNDRILTINKNGELIKAKEPLHWYEPNNTGLDCGFSFAQNLLSGVPKDVSILMLPVAIGGSSTTQWVNDSTYRGVSLLSNFNQKVALGKNYGTIKGIIWHQGESDANGRSLPEYTSRIETLFKHFRKQTGHKKLPVIMGELGGYRKSKNWLELNEKIHTFTSKDKYTGFISTEDLHHKGDNLHFDSESLREMGKRYADKYLLMTK